MDDFLLISTLGQWGSFRAIFPELSGLIFCGGLGIIAWHFSGQTAGWICLVAFDTSANFLKINFLMSPDGALRFAEEALVRGVAVRRTIETPKPRMGVAAGDVNGYSLLDMFITNFFSEANTLYLSQEGGFLH